MHDDPDLLDQLARVFALAALDALERDDPDKCGPPVGTGREGLCGETDQPMNKRDNINATASRT